MPALPRDNNPAEVAAYEAVCHRLEGFDARCSLGWVDGVLTALAAAPPLPTEEDWLQVCTDDVFDRTFADPTDRAQALRALRARLSVLADQLDPEWLLERPEQLRLNPIFEEWTDEGRQMLLDEGLQPEQVAIAQTGTDWAAGFLHAMAAFPARWEAAVPEDEELQQALHMLSSHIQAATWAASSAELAEHIRTYYEGAPPPDRDTLLNEAFFAVQDLRVWQLDAGPAVQTRRVDKLPGRNDPCPCGSGKKFKKCHGA